jgi:hypothetical protein
LRQATIRRAEFTPQDLYDRPNHIGLRRALEAAGVIFIHEERQRQAGGAVRSNQKIGLVGMPGPEHRR